MNHTPAPWHVGDSGVTVFAREGTNKIASQGTDVPINEKSSNARLIAAAPDLLESLQNLFALAVSNVPESQRQTWLTQARAAIAKAKGES